MPVCSYVVFPAPGRTDPLARALESLPGCQVEAAENRELLLLVTETASPAEDRVLRERVESERDIEALVLAFGEIDPETEEADPIGAARARERGAREERPGFPLPVLDRLGGGRARAPGSERGGACG